MRRLWILGVVCSLVVMLGWQPSTLTYASSINVSAGSDIQAAINSASPGDTINLAAGTYHPPDPNGSNITISKNITINGAVDGSGNPAVTISPGSIYAPLFTVTAGVTASLNNVILTNTYGEQGNTGLLHNSGNLTLGNDSITGNDSNNAFVILSEGGATLTLNGTQVTHNQGSTYGGAITLHGGTLNINNSTFSNNSSDWGGAIGTQSGGTITITDSTFTANGAREGTDLYAYGANVTVTGSTFRNSNCCNPLDLVGGTSATVTNSTFSGNSGTAIRVGDVYHYVPGVGPEDDGNGHLSISGSTFTGNRGGDDCSNGGAMSVMNGDATVTNDTFTNNVAGDLTNHQNGAGGAISVGGFSGCSAGGGGDGSLTVTNSTFSGNQAGQMGGAISAVHSTVSVTNSSLSGNSAQYYGGAVSSWDEQYGAQNHVTLNADTLNGNNAPGGSGGAIYNYGYHTADYTGAVMSVVNSTITGNSASDTGGIENWQMGTVTVTNSTIVNNTNGGIHNAYNNQTYPGCCGAFALNDSIVAGNSGYDCNGVITSSGGYNLVQTPAGSCTLTMDYNYSPNPGTMNGLITGQKPRLGSLANNGGPTQTIALITGSPAIDAGNDGTCAGTDQRGVARPIGPHCDLGAYEGSISNPPTTFYVSPSGSDSNDCQSPASPCATIPAAVVLSDAAPGSTISLAAGTYTGRFTLKGHVTITGAGASQTFLDGGGSGPVVTINGGSTDTLSNLTIQNGAVTGPAGGLNNGYSPPTPNAGGDGYAGGVHNMGTLTLQNDTVKNNTVTAGPSNHTYYFAANGASAYGAGVFNNNGTLTVLSSTFTNNVANGGNGTSSGLNGNDAKGGGWGYGAGLDSNGGTVTVANSTFSGNTANGGNGGANGYYSTGGGSGVGAAVTSTGGTMTLINDTLAGNAGYGGVGGRGVWSCCPSNGQGVGNLWGNATVTNTIVANPTAGGNCGGGTFTGSNNVTYGDSSCGGVFTNGNPLLSALADNGGPTQTMSLSGGSAAMDAGNDGVCAASPVGGVDQRGYARPAHTHCTVGALETWSPAPPVSIGVSAPATGTTGQALSVTLTVKDVNGAAVPGYTGTVHFTSSDAHAALPADYTFTNSDAGTHTFSVTPGTAGNQTVTATDTATSTLKGTSGTIAVSNPVPTLTSMSPDTVIAPGSAQTLTVNGTNFVASSVVQWNGASLATSYVSPTQLTATVPSANLATSGTAVVTVSTPAPGGGTTAALPFYITRGATTVTATQSATGTAASSTSTATLGGSGAGTAGSTTATSTGIGTVYVSSYSSDPSGSATFTGAGNYFDVYLSRGNSFSKVVVVDCNLGSGGTTLYWNNAGTWARVSPQSYDATAGCVTFTASSSSSPTLAQLTGTEMAVGHDSVPPTSTATYSTTSGAYTPGAWTSKSVTVSLSAVDDSNGSGVSSITYSATGAQPIASTVTNGSTVSLQVTQEGVTTVSYFATDAAGNAETAHTATINIDRTAPTVSCAAPDGQWHGNEVALTCTSVDPTVANGSSGGAPGSGLKTAGDASFNLTTSVGAGNENFNAATGSHQVCDLAGNCSTAGPLRGNQVDRKAPTTTISTLPTGWAQSVTVTFSATDGGSGVKATYYSLDGAAAAALPAGATLSMPEGTHTLSYYSVDNVGNTEASHGPSRVQVDSTPPAITDNGPTSSPTGTDGGGAAWYNHKVSEKWTATDAGSGLAAPLSGATATFQTTTSGEGTGVTTGSGPVSDIAGNTNPGVSSAPFNIDLTNPTVAVTGSVGGAPYSGGWTAGNVVYTFSCADPAGAGGATASGVKSCPSNGTITQEGISSVSGAASDYAGNSSALVTLTAQIDKTAPITTASGIPAGPVNAPVTVNLSATDLLAGTSNPGSGVRSITYSVKDAHGNLASGGTVTGAATSFTVSAEGTYTLTYSAIDNVGNQEATHSAGFVVDTSKPTISGSPSTAANSAGWYNVPVTITWTCADPNLADGSAGSGVASCQAPSAIASDGAAQTVSGAVADHAGNTNTASSPSVSIDTAAPVSKADAGAYSFGSWTVSAVTVALTAQDFLSDGTTAGSGVKSIAWSVTGGGAARSGSFDAGGGSVPFNSEGVYTLTYRATDVAGNVEAPHTVTVKIDKTKPATVASGIPAGWTNAAVTVGLSASDLLGDGQTPGSGVQQINWSYTDHAGHTTSGAIQGASGAVTIASEGTYVLTYSAVDAVGNQETAHTAPITVDTSPPTISGGVVNADGSTRAPNAAGWYRTPVTVHFSCADPALADGSAGSGVKSCSPDATLLDGASQSATGQTADVAGNTNSATVSGINVDTAAPVTSATAGAYSFGSWTNGPVTVNLSASDSFGNGVPGFGSGVAQLAYTVKDAQGNTVASASGATANVSLTLQSEGTYTVSYAATDVAGNVESTHTQTVRIDETAPTLSGSPTTAVAGTDTGGNAWYRTDVTVGWLCADPVNASNGTPGSGLAVGCPSTTITGEGVGLASTTTVSDVAGNSTSKTVKVNIDRTAPVTTATYAAPNSFSWYNTPVSMTLAATDLLGDGTTAGSGVAATYFSVDGGATQTYTTPFTLSEGKHSVRYWSVDHVGNVEAAHTTGVNVDLTKPTFTVTGTPVSGVFSVDQTATITCQAGDNLSGLATLTGTACGSLSAVGTLRNPVFTLLNNVNAYDLLQKAGGATPAYGSDSSTLSADGTTATYTYTAAETDEAGNAQTVAIMFTVSDTYDSLCSLVKQITADAGEQTSLCAKLAAAKDSAARGNSNSKAGQLNAFMHEVAAQAGKKIPTQAQADLLTDLAKRLLAQTP